MKWINVRDRLPPDNDEVLVRWVSDKDRGDVRYFNASIQVNIDGLRDWFMFGKLKLDQSIAGGGIEEWTSMINFYGDSEL